MKNPARLRLWAVLMGAAFCLAVEADTLYLRDGEQATGQLVRMTKDKVWFKDRDGLKKHPKAAVQKIELQRARPFDDFEKADQVTDPDLKACLAAEISQPEYATAGFVTWLERVTYDLTKPGIVKETVRRIIKVQKQRGEEAASQNAWYFEDTDTPAVDFALTVTPDGRVLHLSDVALKSESIYASIPDYRRLARLRFACKEPRPGSVLDFQFTVERKRDAALNPFYAEELFKDEQPLLHKEVIVLVPASREGEILTHLDLYDAASTNVVAAQREQAADLVTLRWTLTQPQAGIVPEPFLPPRESYVPRLVLALATTWDKTAGQYAAALTGLAPLPDDLVAKAKKLAEQGGASAIYNFVTRTIRTVPVPQGHFRFVPHPAGDTARRGVANELDKNYLYLSMLRAAGIEATFALVRSRNRGPLAGDVPSLRAFDRSAVLIDAGGRFSTTSSDLLPFDALPGQLHCAPAMITTEKGALLTETQQPAPKDDLDLTQYDAVLAPDGTLKIDLTYTGTGDSVAPMRKLKDLDQQQLRNQLQQWAGAVHPAAVLDAFTTSDLADLTVDPKLTMRCTIPGYASAAGEDLMLFTLPALFYTARDVGRPQREHALFWPTVSRTATIGAIRIPDGFTVYSMPKPVQFDSPAASYEARLAGQKNSISFADAFDLKVEQAPREAYADYKQSVELRARIPDERIILSREAAR